MQITEYIKNNIVCLDGGMGTLLQKKGLLPGEFPERWNISHPDIITAIHTDYYNSGSNIVCTNTFGANSLKFNDDELELIIKSAIENAKTAQKNSHTDKLKWIAFDMGPTGKMLAPYGDLDFEDAVSIFAKSVRLAEKYGADIIFIETMNDCYETKAALLAAKENCSLPVFVSNAYSNDGHLMTGASPIAMIAMLEGMGADAIGINCSYGPKDLTSIIKEYIKYSSLPIIFKPNAGLPKAINGETKYNVSPQEFASDVAEIIKDGVHLVGGCCGTTPEYISELTTVTEKIQPKPIDKKNITCVSSYSHAVIFDKLPILIGERINPTGKKKFKEALKNNDMDYILNEGINQKEKGVHILDVNVGLPEIDEVQMLKNAVCELQAIIDLPLQIDSSDAVAMEKALRCYNGKAMINSVNGKKESMDAIFPLAKKYGGLIVALTLDENGIPESAEERFKIAEKILNEAKKYGIDKKDLIFDPLALTISADDNAAKETLKAVHLIKDVLGCHTSLGVSNVSFGLPQRDVITSSFFTIALANGLSAAIMNPYSVSMMNSYHSFCALSGFDKNCAKYIQFAQESPQTAIPQSASFKVKSDYTFNSELQNAIIKGLKEKAASITEALLSTIQPLDIIKNEIIPALDIVGTGFENKTVYLPELLMSAEAAKHAFEKIKDVMPADSKSDKCTIVLATVKGDIHDIGKNIVKLILENYGFDVCDLGKDVTPETIVQKVVDLKAPIVALSALMTTTVPSMEETIRLIKKDAPFCKTIVGGAVLTKDYADLIGADFYGKDAMEAVKFADKINNSIK